LKMILLFTFEYPNSDSFFQRRLPNLAGFTLAE
jgi:hypothetical protein